MILQITRLYTFQSTHPRGVRPNFIPVSLLLCAISIHAPAWGATPNSIFVSGRRQISIHAPAWGATVLQVLPSFVGAISIHAPAWGATCTRCMLLSSKLDFNPRTRVGCDLSLLPPYSAAPLISIHAPAWGATFQKQRMGHRSNISIHAPAWGATTVFP